MPSILHIESATPICSVALSKGDQLIDLKEIDKFNSHSEVLTLFVDELLNTNGLKYKDLDAIAVSNGPGSYTGLRIGASTAKGLAYALDIPVITVNSIEALAIGLKESFPDSGNKNYLYCPMIDARRMEVYTTFYDASHQVIKALTPFIIDEENLKYYLENYTLILGGSGAEKCFEIYKSYNNIILDSELKSSAKYLIPLAIEKYRLKNFADLAYFEPNYLKDFIGK